MRAGYPRGSNKGLSSKFCNPRLRQEGSRFRSPEEGRRVNRPKRCEHNNNKDEDSSPNNSCTRFSMFLFFLNLG